MPIPLELAAEIVTADYREETQTQATLSQAIAHTRAEVDLDDIATLADDGTLSAEVADAYRVILTAEPAAIDALVTGQSTTR